MAGNGNLCKFYSSQALLCEGTCAVPKNKELNTCDCETMFCQTDWTEHNAPDGRKYYYNNKSKESKWEKPDELKTPAESMLAKCAWKEFKADSGKPYYYNSETKQSVWTIPKDLQEIKGKYYWFWVFWKAGSCDRSFEFPLKLLMLWYDCCWQLKTEMEQHSLNWLFFLNQSISSLFLHPFNVVMAYPLSHTAHKCLAHMEFYSTFKRDVICLLCYFLAFGASMFSGCCWNFIGPPHQHGRTYAMQWNKACGE